ncbi:MAG TPA: ATP-binding cassette domain-containing protein [Fimbriiglobus sp.]
MIELTDLAVRQGAFALDGISFQIESGQYAVLTGQTGAGKTTLLEVVAGLRRPSRGIVRLNGTDATHFPPRARGVGYVPQDGALFRTMTVQEQLAFALTVRKVPTRDVAVRVGELAEWLGIAHLLNRRPAGLSGGETQRVALGRALAAKPNVLLLDEPLSAQDDETRAGLTEILLQLRNARQTSVLHITHNRAEAEALADVRFHLEKGRLAPVNSRR